jgi:hypothetical protein
VPDALKAIQREGNFAGTCFSCRSEF